MIVEVIRPNITEEERKRRIAEVSRLAGSMVREIYQKQYEKELQEKKKQAAKEA